MKEVTTYLTFDGNCREAISFYGKCLGGELQLTRR
jgi:PhnB protein